MQASKKYSIQSMSPQLLVADIERSLAFYTGLLGFVLTFNYQDFYCGISKDGYSVHLKHATTAPEELANRKENGHLDLVIAVTAVAPLYQYMLQQCVTILQPLCERDYGTEFYIADPDGYIIAFLEGK